MSLRLHGGKLRKSFPREFVIPVVETAIHSCSVPRFGYNTKRIPRDFENVRMRVSSEVFRHYCNLLSAFTFHLIVNFKSDSCLTKLIVSKIRLQTTLSWT